MKQIYLEVLLNGNEQGRVINLTDEQADALIALFNEAKETILKDVEEEDWYLTFDPWLKAKAPELYDNAIKQWHYVFAEELNEGVPESLETLNRFMSVERDLIDGTYLTDDNEICINGLFVIKK